MNGNEQTGLRFERQFDVSRAQIFDALTKPDQMRVWWGADAEIAVDLRVGGAQDDHSLGPRRRVPREGRTPRT